MRHLLRLDDMQESEIDLVVQRSMSLAASGERSVPQNALVVGLLFLSPSLRTRVGFAVAARHAGAHPLEVTELRYSAAAMSAPESFEHTLRTVSGMVDLLVVRAPIDLTSLDLETWAQCPVINGGDVHHHPTQALIDLVAIHAELGGAAAEATIGVVGDLNQRAVRSLVDLSERKRLAPLRLIAPPSRRPRWTSRGLSSCSTAESMDVEDLDVLYVAGLPERDPTTGDELRAPDREKYAVTAATLARLPRDAVVLSPLPVIDEIAADVWIDPRIRCFRQSDRAVTVRRAVLELFLAAEMRVA